METTSATGTVLEKRLALSKIDRTIIREASEAGMDLEEYRSLLKGKIEREEGKSRQVPPRLYHKTEAAFNLMRYEERSNRRLVYDSETNKITLI